jgi:hypothetical protein
MIFSENRYPSPIGVEDMLFGIMRGALSGVVITRRTGRGNMTPMLCPEAFLIRMNAAFRN